MKAIGTHVARPVKVQQTATKHQAKVAVIKDAVTNEILHCGSPRYIRQVAKAKYNLVAKF